MATDSSSNVSEAEFLVTVVDAVPVAMTIQRVGSSIMVCWPTSCRDYELFSSSARSGLQRPYWMPVLVSHPDSDG